VATCALAGEGRAFRAVVACRADFGKVGLAAAVELLRAVDWACGALGAVLAIRAVGGHAGTCRAKRTARAQARLGGGGEAKVLLWALNGLAGGFGAIGSGGTGFGGIRARAAEGTLWADGRGAGAWAAEVTSRALNGLASASRAEESARALAAASGLGCGVIRHIWGNARRALHGNNDESCDDDDAETGCHDLLAFSHLFWKKVLLHLGVTPHGLVPVETGKRTD